LNKTAESSNTQGGTDNQFLFPAWLDNRSKPRPPHRWGFEITLRHTTHGRSPLDRWL